MVYIYKYILYMHLKTCIFIVASLPNPEGSWFIMDLMLVSIDAVILGLEVFQDADLGTMG